MPVDNIPHLETLVTNPKQGTEELSYALTSQNSLFNILFSESRTSLFAKKLELALKEQFYQGYPEYKNNLEWEILQSILIQGCFYAYISHFTNDNVDDVVRIIGEINDCLIRNYMDNHSIPD